MQISINQARNWLEDYYLGPPLHNLADAIGVSRVTLWRMQKKTDYLPAKYRDRFLRAYPGYRK